MKFHFVYIGRPTLTVDSVPGRSLVESIYRLPEQLKSSGMQGLLEEFKSSAMPKLDELKELFGAITAAIDYFPIVASGTLNINFWCEAHYKDSFEQLIMKTGLPIRIRVIEALWDSRLTPAHVTHEGIEFLRHHLCALVNGLIATETVRGRVSVKDIIAFLLLYFEGGWYFDNNVAVKPDMPEPSTSQVVKSARQSESYYLSVPFFGISQASAYGQDNDTILTREQYILCMKELGLNKPRSRLLLGYDKNRWKESSVTPITLPEGTLPDIWQMGSPQYHPDFYGFLYVYCVVYSSVIKDAQIYSDDPLYHSCCYKRIGAIGLEVIHAALLSDFLFEDSVVNRRESIEDSMNRHFIPEDCLGDKIFFNSHCYKNADEAERQRFLEYIRNYPRPAISPSQGDSATAFVISSHQGGAAAPAPALPPTPVLPKEISKCSVCGTITTKRCSACHLVFYCSAVCQRGAWKSHKLTCKKCD